jgi:glycosyltransferase involved in cell wall biosynthesis
MIAHCFYRVSGGEDRYVQQQVDLLRGRHDVELLARSNESLDARFSTAVAMTYSRRMIRHVEEEIGAFGPDVIHLHNPYPALGPSVHLAAGRLGVPLVQTVHNLRLRCPNGLMFTEGRECHRCEAGNYANAILHSCFPSRTQATAYAGALWAHRFPMKLEKRVGMFIAPSEFIRGRLMGWGISADRVRMIRNFGPPALPAPTSVGAYGVYVGRLRDEKGVNVLLRALALAGDPAFRIIGTGPEEAGLKQLASELGLEKLEFTGHLSSSELSLVLADCRFLVMPSRCAENAPLAVLEAFAAGKPVLVTRMGGLPELVQNGAGLVCEAEDEDSMGREIRRLMEDDDLCSRLGNSARALAQEELSAERHLMGLEATYRDVLEQAPDRRPM